MSPGNDAVDMIFETLDELDLQRGGKRAEAHHENLTQAGRHTIYPDQPFRYFMSQGVLLSLLGRIGWILDGFEQEASLDPQGVVLLRPKTFWERVLRRTPYEIAMRDIRKTREALWRIQNCQDANDWARRHSNVMVRFQQWLDNPLYRLGRRHPYR